MRTKDEIVRHYFDSVYGNADSEKRTQAVLAFARGQSMCLNVLWDTSVTPDYEDIEKIAEGFVRSLENKKAPPVSKRGG